MAIEDFLPQSHSKIYYGSCCSKTLLNYLKSCSQTVDFVLFSYFTFNFTLYSVNLNLAALFNHLHSNECDCLYSKKSQITETSRWWSVIVSECLTEACVDVGESKTSCLLGIWTPLDRPHGNRTIQKNSDRKMVGESLYGQDRNL